MKLYDIRRFELTICQSSCTRARRPSREWSEANEPSAVNPEINVTEIEIDNKINSPLCYIAKMSEASRYTDCIDLFILTIENQFRPEAKQGPKFIKAVKKN